MPQSFITQLIAFIVTPYGIVGIAMGVLMLVQATRSRPTAWLLLSMCCFAASLSKFEDRWTKSPPLVVPLQQIREYGRPLAIVLLILLVVLAMQTRSNWRREILPEAIKYLCWVQFVIVFKTYVYGSQEFAILSALTFGGIVYMLRRGPGLWMNDDENFKLAVKSLSMAGVIFIIANLYQFLLNRSAVTFVQGRFMGTTGNPIHAATLLATTIPCCLFMIQSSPVKKFAKSFWIAILMPTIYFLILTGSRTGMMMAVISVLLFYRNNSRAWVRIILMVGIVALMGVTFLQPDNFSSSSTGIDTNVSDRLVSTDNTRENVWNGMWNAFTQNIIFGAPLEAGGRMGYGENSWLAAGASLGLAGFIPMLMMGWKSIELMLQLHRLSERQPYYFFQCSTIISGLGSMLVGSWFEAFLLGNITFSMLAFLMYLLMGGYLIEVDRVRTYYAKIEAETVDRSGVYQ